MRNVVMKYYPSIDYVLIARVQDDDSVYEYVAAFNYDDEDGTWAQGHYFSELDNAIEYLNEKCEERHKEVIEQYENDPMVHEGWAQQDLIDSYRRER